MKNRGDIWWINFDPSIGQEIKKKRPAVIVSNNISNQFLQRYQVVPCTTNVDKLYPSEAMIMIGNIPNKITADQIMTVSKLRFISKIGSVSNEEMKQIEQAIKTQLDL